MSTSNTVDHNKAVAVEFLRLISAGDIDRLCELITPTWTMRGGPPDLPAGEIGLRTLFGTFGHIDQSWTVDDVIAEGDRVVVRATNTCAQESFFGVPASGVTQTFTATFTHRLDDGRIDATWRNADDLGRLLQLGARILSPAPAES